MKMSSDNIECDKCGKRFYSRDDNYYYHVESCTRSRNRATVKDEISDDYSAYIKKLKEYYENAIHQIQGKYESENSQLRNAVDAITVANNKQREESAYVNRRETQDMKQKIAELERTNTDLLSKIKSISINNTLDSNLQTQYTRDLANKNVEIAQLKQELEQLKTSHFAELQNRQISFNKRFIDLEQSNRIDSEKLKTDYENRITLLEHNIIEQRKTFEQQLYTKLQKYESLYSKEIDDLKKQLEERERKYNISLKQVTKESESIVSEIKTKLRHTTDDFTYTNTKLQDITKKLFEIETNKNEELRKMKLTHEQAIKENTETVIHLRSKVKYLQDMTNKHLEELKQVKADKNNMEERTNIDMNNLRHKVRQIQENSEKACNNYMNKEEELATRYQNQLTEQAEKISSLTDLCSEFEKVKTSYSTSVKYAEGLKKQLEEYAEHLRQLQALRDNLKLEAKTSTEKIQNLTSSNTDLQNKIVSLSKDTNMLNVEKQELILAVNSQRDQISNLESNYKDIQDKYHSILNSTSMTIKDEKQFTEHLKAELSKLTLQLKDMDDVNASLKNNELLVEKLRENLKKSSKMLETRNAEYTNLCTDFGNSVAQNEAYQHKIKELQDIINRYENKINQLRQETERSQSQITTLERDYRRKTDEYNNLKKEKERFELENTCSKNKIVAQVNEINNLSAEKNTMTGRYNELKMINDTMAQTTNQLKKNMDTANGKCIALTEQASISRKEIDQIRSEFKDYIQCKEDIITELNAKIKTGNLELSNTRKQMADYEKALKDITALENLTQTQKQTIMSLTTDIHILQSNSEKIICKLKSELTESNKDLSLIEEKLRLAENKSTGMEQKIKNVDVLESRIQEYQTIVADLKDFKCKFIDSENSKNRYKTMYQNANKECETLKTLSEEHAKLLSTYKDLKSANHTLQCTLNKNNAKITSLDTSIQKHLNTITIQNKTIDTLNASLQNSKGIETELYEKITLLQNNYKDEKASILLRLNKYDEQYKKMETDLAFSNGKLSNLESNTEKLQMLSVEHDALTNQMNKAKRMNSELKANCEELEKTINDEKVKYMGLQKSFNASQEENKELVRSVEKITKMCERNSISNKNTVEGLTIQLTDLHSKYKTACEKEVDIRQKVAHIEELKQECKKLARNVENISKLNKEISDKNIKLDTELDTLTKKYNLSRLYEVQVNNLISENKSLKTAYSETLEELAHLKSIFSQDLHSENETFKQTIQELTKNLNDTLTENEHYKRECRNLERDSSLLLEYKDKIFGLESIVNSLRQRNKEIETQLNELPSTHDIQLKEERIQALYLENATLVKRLSALHPQIRSLDKLKDNDKQQKNLLQEKENTINSLNTRIDALNLQIAEFTNTLQLLRDETIKIKKTIEPLKTKIEEQKLEITRLQEAPDKLDVKVKRLRDDSMATIHKYINADKSTKRALLECKDRISSLEENIMSLTNEIDQNNADKEHLLVMKEELKHNFLHNLNEQKMSGTLQVQEMTKLIELRDNRIRDLEELLNAFVKKQLNV